MQVSPFLKERKKKKKHSPSAEEYANRSEQSGCKLEVALYLHYEVCESKAIQKILDLLVPIWQPPANRREPLFAAYFISVALPVRSSNHRQGQPLHWTNQPSERQLLSQRLYDVNWINTFRDPHYGWTEKSNLPAYYHSSTMSKQVCFIYQPITQIRRKGKSFASLRSLQWSNVIPLKSKGKVEMKLRPYES